MDDTGLHVEGEVLCAPHSRNTLSMTSARQFIRPRSGQIAGDGGGLPQSLQRAEIHFGEVHADGKKQDRLEAKVLHLVRSRSDCMI